MKADEEIVAKKYACAFLNCYEKEISLQEYTVLDSACQALKKYKQFLHLLDASFLSAAEKEKGLKILIQECRVPLSLEPLCRLLGQHHRLFLLPLVIHFTKLEYSKRYALLPMTIKTSAQVSEADIDLLKKFLSLQTGCQIIATSVVDRSLIAGIRMESIPYIWEHSIAKQLRQVSRQVIS